MKTLLKNGLVVNVFTDELEKANVLIEDGKIIGVGDYTDVDADIIEDVSGKYICPGFIDGHIHIESTMLAPSELARVCVACGTTAIVADPHEIANVCGTDGLEYMLQASESLPMTVYMVLPSCVPASGFDESGAVLEAEDLNPLYNHVRVIGLGEMMNYPGVLCGNESVLRKINDSLALGKIVNGHAPLLSGKALDKYISAGIFDDHECSSVEEACERIRKGQFVMIRRGSAARDLEKLLPLFKEPWSRRCMLVTDDYHADDILEKGHINSIIRESVQAGNSPLVGIRMATIQAASYFGLKNIGAVSPGYIADLIVLEDLNNVTVKDVYKNGKKVVCDQKVTAFSAPVICDTLTQKIRGSFELKTLTENDFMLSPQSNKCRVIKVMPGTLISDEIVADIDFFNGNGIDIDKDILKLAVVERYGKSGNIGLGFITGIGMKKGAIASSVSHDSHNLIVIGTNESDMAFAANRIRELGGGCIVVDDGKIICELPLPIGGLMSDMTAVEVASKNAQLNECVGKLGIAHGINPFMNMSFVALSVIPHLKMTTLGLVNVDNQEIVPLFV